MTTKKVADAAPERVDGPVLVDNTDQKFVAAAPAETEEVALANDVVQVNYL